MEKRTLTIGQVAQEAGVNRETLRYYERRGLVVSQSRSVSGYRLYPVSAPQVVCFIKRAQKLGFSLSEIQDLLALRDNSQRRCADVQDLAESRLSDIEAKIEQLTAVRDTLAALVNTCSTQKRAPDCPILDALDSVTPLGKKEEH